MPLLASIYYGWYLLWVAY